MTSNFSTRDPKYDAMMHALIEGWSKSRAGDEVSIIHGPGYAHCIFTHPIGKISRNRESFYWNCDRILLTSIDFHADNHHFLSIIDVNDIVQENLLTAGYRILHRETHMYREVNRSSQQLTDTVRRIETREEVDWYNGQKKNNLIKTPESLDPCIYYFYTQEGNVMTSHARAVHSGDYFVIDDVHTHPDHRRKGLASKILSAINHEASVVKAKTLTLISSDEGIPVYLRNDFLKGQHLTVFSSPNYS